MKLVLNFGCNAFSGWGVVGMNLAGLLNKHYEVIFGAPTTASAFCGMDPLRFRPIEEIIARGFSYDPEECIVIDPVGNDLKGSVDYAHKLIGRVIVEKPDLKSAMQNLERYDALITGSNWNKQILEDATGRDVTVIHEGVDPSLFYPAPRCGWLGDTFKIYSAGKVEYRKAQDVTLLAFKRFSERHADARLVTMWQSPFTDLANGFKGICERPIWMGENGQLDIKRWAADNGVDPGKVLDVGIVPNFVVPQILHEMDVMLAPSRVESCQSLPVLEAMACGVPVIYGNHSGMLDIKYSNKGLRLNCKPISASTEYFMPNHQIDWYEADADEIDSALETAYMLRPAERNWDYAEVPTWKRHVKSLKAFIAETMLESCQDPEQAMQNGDGTQYAY